MKSMLALVLMLSAATSALGQDLSRPLPSVIQSALPASTPAATLVSHPSNWGGNCLPPMAKAACPAPQALCPAHASGGSAYRGTACERLRNWLTFRVCEPNHESHVPYPYHSPLRAYFPVTPAPLGFNGPLDCNSTRPRLLSWTPKDRGAPACGTPTCSVPMALPATRLTYAQPTRACDFPSVSMERKGFFERLTSIFRMDGCGLNRCPMMCGGTCAATGRSGYPYAENSAAMMYPGVPAPVSATRPFTNP